MNKAHARAMLAASITLGLIGTGVASATAAEDPAEVTAQLVTEAAPDSSEIITDVSNHGDIFVAETGEGDSVVIPQDPEASIVLSSPESQVEDPDGDEDGLVAPDVEIPLADEARLESAQLASDGTVVYQGEGRNDVDIAVQATESGGVRVQMVIPNEQAPTSFTFRFPEATIELREDGGAYIIGSDDGIATTILGVAPPWAIDANGANVPTHYEVVGDALVQVVEPGVDTAYPIVADPDYDKYVLNVKDVVWCTANAILTPCIVANDYANIAVSQARSWYTAESLYNGRGDAFRHCYWNAIMTSDFGLSIAKKIADRHETTAAGQPAIQKDMDLKNNAIGRGIVGGKSSKPWSTWRDTCRLKANTAQLYIIRNGKVVLG